MWENSINVEQICEIRSKSIVYLGVGAISKINDIASNLKSRNITKIIAVTGKKAYRSTGAWNHVVKALEQSGIDYTIYDGVTPNPTTHQVDEATKMAIEFGARAVISIGGGSPIDAAKSVAILINYPENTAQELYEYSFTPTSAVPLIAINLTHGTGTEIDRFAVVSIPEKEFKPYIAYDFIYPEYSIDDPGLMLNLPEDQTLYVTIDALNHVIEACTSKAASPYSIMLAKETARLIAKYLPIVKENPKDLKARYFLTYASMIAGVSFDNGLLHFTHALEHPLSAIKPDLAHGLGLSLIVPAVVRQIYSASCQTLADVLSPIIPDLKGTTDESDKVFVDLRNWIEKMGITPGLKNAGYSEKDIEHLTNLAFDTPGLASLLSLAPVEASRTVVSDIYTRSL
ncbi:iron-containing alcohol dehydrogenase [Pseudobacteroides cellulosolvens]|uniref:Alcohol dehydrogenase n=1 Tax=Pseudobacteroides cellulosolvens ATCC 35603 = DSM 2933 TaxID=398512 RepID=A0A0L6JRF0_9FIRM|nr:iron-containing alcohol dehydrogenase [Pseudobacteroides cellulosolvens]KNY27972.1 Alcohol dehydrogenase [Pseudobacteroides cellulosolvens ATCC 35603 = DSM 2933]